VADVFVGHVVTRWWVTSLYERKKIMNVKRVIISLAVLIVVGGFGWWFLFLKPVSEHFLEKELQHEIDAYLREIEPAMVSAAYDWAQKNYNKDCLPEKKCELSQLLDRLNSLKSGAPIRQKSGIDTWLHLHIDINQHVQSVAGYRMEKNVGPVVAWVNFMPEDWKMRLELTSTHAAMLSCSESKDGVALRRERYRQERMYMDVYMNELHIRVTKKGGP
jgi:hypothetical protein